MLQTQKKTNTDHPEAIISPEYKLGDSISVDYQPAVREFQMRVSLYEVTAGNDAGTNPIKMMVLPIHTVANTTTTKILKPYTTQPLLHYLKLLRLLVNQVYLHLKSLHLHPMT